MDRPGKPLTFLVAFFTFGCVSLLSQGQATRNAQPEPRGKFSGRPFAATFTDIAEKAGLLMPFTSGDNHRKRYIVEANGSGVAFIDYDNDGWLDIFLVNGSRLENAPADAISRLYRNGRNGTFTDVTSDTGTGRAGWGNGVCAGDFDNDGFEDLYITYWGPNVLYRNTGKGKFEDVTEGAGVAGPREEWSSGCTFIDYDGDGALDLFVVSYQKFDLAATPEPGKGANCEWKGMPVFCGPRGLPHGSARLYRNRRDGKFDDVTRASRIGAASGFYAFTTVAADLNQDGWTDLYVASDSTPSLFFRNDRDGTFSEIATETGIAYNEHGFEQGGMGLAVGDIDGDGRLDLLKTNFTGDYPNVYQNQGGGIFEDIVVRAGLAVNPQYVGWGIGLADLDNDGWPDVFQVNGHVYPELDSREGSERYRNPRLVYRNLGGAAFEDVGSLAGAGVADLRSSRGAAFGDFDNDGDIDVVVMNMGERPSLLRNDLRSENRWIRVKVHGTKSNRSGIGATVTVEHGGRRQTLPVLSQSSFLSQNDLRLHFGLGKSPAVDRIVVRWPTGVTETFPGAEAGQTMVVTEGQGSQ